ncbi:MAG TPA: P63C domain-containing protein [Pirellulaceae bacterium]|nr:P63C domain-containing protein [Pirellulaceae bacterium]
MDDSTRQPDEPFALERASKGGKARAAKLSKKQRSEIARLGGEARGKIPVADFEGEIVFSDTLKIPCAVLPGEVRVISERGFTKALGGKRGGSHWKRMKEGGAKLPVFLSAHNLNEFIGKDLQVALSQPTKYKFREGGVAHGIEASLIPDICEVFLKARDAGALTAPQEKLAAVADLMTRGLAKVGIIALVDEATGFQHFRTKTALIEVLKKYITADLVKWVKLFPDDFYKHLFRLRGWRYSTETTRRPILVGKLTINLVYERMPPGVLNELRKHTPRNEKGRLKHKLTQHLTENAGHPALKTHFTKLLTLMEASRDYDELLELADRAMPKQKDPREMPLFQKLMEAEDAAPGSIVIEGTVNEKPQA